MLVFYGSLHPEVQATNFCFEVELQFLPGDSQWFIVLPRPVWCSLANLKSSQPFRSAFLMLKVLHLIKVLGFCLNRCEHYLVVRLLLANKMVHVVPWLGNDIVTYPIQLVCVNPSIGRLKQLIGLQMQSHWSSQSGNGWETWWELDLYQIMMFFFLVFSHSPVTHAFFYLLH